MTEVASHNQSSSEASEQNFGAVYEAEFSYVWHTLRRLGANEADVEDLTQDVFVVVHRRLGDYDPARPIRPWLFGIAYRVLRDFRRRPRHYRELSSEDAGTTAEPNATDPEKDLQAKQKRQLVLMGLCALDDDRRAVFVMHDIDGHSMPEIAKVLSAPLNTLYSRLRLARRDFAAAVKKERRLRGEDERAHA